MGILVSPGRPDRPPALKLDHVRLLVDDFGEAFRFYRDRLGLDCTYGDESGPYANFSTEPATLSIFTREGQSTTTELREPGDGALVPLEVEDVDSEAERLELAEPVSRPGW